MEQVLTTAFFREPTRGQSEHDPSPDARAGIVLSRLEDDDTKWIGHKYVRPKSQDRNVFPE